MVRVDTTNTCCMLRSNYVLKIYTPFQIHVVAQTGRHVKGKGVFTLTSYISTPFMKLKMTILLTKPKTSRGPIQHPHFFMESKVPTHKVPTYRARFGTLGKGRVNMIVARLTSHKLSVFLGLGHSCLGSAKHEICADYMLPSFVGGVLVSRKKRTNKQTNKQKQRCSSSSSIVRFKGTQWNSFIETRGLNERGRWRKCALEGGRERKRES